MSGKVLFVLFSFLFILSFKDPVTPAPSLQSVQAAYKRADAMFNNPNSTSATDSICIGKFKEIISAISGLPGSVLIDSLMFESNYKLGVLSEEFKDFRGAKSAYLRATGFTSNATDKFRICVLAGSAYYNLNNFDSATFYLLQAEEQPNNIGSPADRVRLYNSLGVLFYDNGNYIQSKNYFNQALRLINASKKLADDLIVYTQLNLATCSYKLGLYDQSLAIYRKLEKDHMLPDPLYLNMGKAYSGLHQYGEALSTYKKVTISAEPGVLNEMAKTALETGQTDSARIWLDDFRNHKKTARFNILDEGVNELYYGDLFLNLHLSDSALLHLQRALIIFSGNFSAADTRKNPVKFTGSFAYYRLFEVLSTKALAWEGKYKKTANPADLKSAFDCYQSAISLLSYIERSYEMDDAKIMLKEKSSGLYMKAMEVALQLNTILPKENFLESAFLISEKNKASIMSAQIRESNLLGSTGKEGGMSDDERNIKYNIARLNARMDEGGTTADLQKLNDEKSEYESRLVILRRKMEGNNRFYNLKYSDDFPSIEALQKQIQGNQALISFFNQPDKIDVFILTRSKLDHIQLDSGELIRKKTSDWIEVLQTAESGRHVKSSGLRLDLFSFLVKPILELAGDKKEWIIVPDGMLFQLPFESLPVNEKGKTVLEDHAVSYEFSARFIMEDKRNIPVAGNRFATLSFAPYALQSADLQKEGMGHFEKLPFSAKEISGLAGQRYTDRVATKQNFIRDLNHYPIIHLATHAMTDLLNPSSSYVAFYPLSGLRSDDFLFLDEIYSLRMDSCQMMVISACETGKGALVHNEGVMSFARAFLYAGCPSTINTLWKADDRSTAEILIRFYKYLDEGETKAVAMQKAKLDFIHENPIYRNPAYWSHIIIMGNADALYKKKQPWIWVALIAGICVIALIFLVSRSDKRPGFHGLKKSLQY